MDFSRISVEEAQALIEEEALVILDIRDEASYAAGHLPGALHIKDIQMDDFLSRQDKEKPLLVYCYHGHSSLPAAAYFADRGFRQCCSLDGGYEAWRAARK